MGQLGMCWIGAAVRAVNYYFPDCVMDYVTPRRFRREFPGMDHFWEVWTEEFNDSIRDSVRCDQGYPPYVAAGNIWAVSGGLPSAFVPALDDAFVLFPELVSKVPSGSVGIKDGPRRRSLPNVRFQGVNGAVAGADSPGSERSSGSLQPVQQSTITAADQTALVVRVSESSRAVENTALTRGNDEPIVPQAVDTEPADRRMDPQDGVNLEPSEEPASHVIQSAPQAEALRPYFFAVGRPRLPLNSYATNNSVSQKQPSVQEVWDLVTVMGQQMAAFRKEKEEQDVRIYDQQSELDNAQRRMKSTVDALYAKEQVAVNELRVVKKRLRNAQEELNRRLSMDPAGSNG
ncbi:MAG: hypothetical protein GY696_32275, partial [Gammaproteobacteria bacterium]|nr:hypothetical protein [Gammaproteobacteria bacterium]